MIKLTINDIPFAASEGSTAAAAVLASGAAVFRRSVTGEARGPLCGMGVCSECRVRINGVVHVRSCMTIVEEGMEVDTGDRDRN